MSETLEVRLRRLALLDDATMCSVYPGDVVAYFDKKDEIAQTLRAEIERLKLDLEIANNTLDYRTNVTDPIIENSIAELLKENERLKEDLIQAVRHLEYIRCHGYMPDGAIEALLEKYLDLE